MQSEKIRVVIVDDHEMFIDGLVQILSVEDDIEIVETCLSAHKIFDESLLAKTDVILLDINLPDINGIDVCKRLRASHPHINILVLSMYDEESYITEVLKSGAMGYILKNTGKKELITAIRTVVTGKSYFSESVTKTIMNGLMNNSKTSKKTSTIQKPKITPREREVLDLIIKENTNQEIAGKLFISLKTVEAHRSSLLSKLNARNTAGLVRIALQSRILEQV